MFPEIVFFTFMYLGYIVGGGVILFPLLLIQGFIGWFGGDISWMLGYTGEILDDDRFEIPLVLFGNLFIYVLVFYGIARPLARLIQLRLSRRQTPPKF